MHALPGMSTSKFWRLPYRSFSYASQLVYPGHILHGAVVNNDCDTYRLRSSNIRILFVTMPCCSVDKSCTSLSVIPRSYLLYETSGNSHLILPLPGAHNHVTRSEGSPADRAGVRVTHPLVSLGLMRPYLVSSARPCLSHLLGAAIRNAQISLRTSASNKSARTSSIEPLLSLAMSGDRPNVPPSKPTAFTRHGASTGSRQAVDPMAGMRAFLAARQNAHRRSTTPASSAPAVAVETPPPVDEGVASVHAGTRRPLEEDTPLTKDDTTPPAKKAKANNTVVSEVTCVLADNANELRVSSRSAIVSMYS